MHAIFIPYGMRSKVELLLRDMEAQKHKLRCWKKGEKDKYIWMQAQVRVLPFGIMEYVFPKEDMDLVLTTLGFHLPCRYSLGKMEMGILRKALKIEPIPEFKTDKKLLWITKDMWVIPLGIRRDGDMIEKDTKSKGWSHEAI